MRHIPIARLLILLIGGSAVGSMAAAQDSTAHPEKALVAISDAPSDARSSTPSPEAPRPLHELTKDARTALRAEATLEDQEDWELAIRALVALNDELRVHPKNREGSSFAKLKRSVRRRLLATQKELAKSEDSQDSASQPPEISNETVLAQQFGGGAAGRGGGFAGGGQVGIGGGGAPVGDYGEELVDLIERTISADAWDSVGGSAVIMYHQPNHALIITAPLDIHENVADLLRQLRAAGP